MKFIAFIIFTLIINSIFSQKTGKEETLYTTEIDNPNINFIGFGVHILSYQIDPFNSPIKFGGEAYAKLGKFYAGAKSFLGEGLIYEFGSEKSSPIYSAYESGSDFLNVETTAGYNISSKETIEDIQITILRQGNIYYYVKVPTTIQKSYGIEASINQGFMHYTAKAKHISGKPTLPLNYEGTVNLGDEFGYDYMSTNYRY